MRDYLNNDSDSQDDETEKIFRKFSNFLTAIENAFGNVDETRLAIQTIQELR